MTAVVLAVTVGTFLPSERTHKPAQQASTVLRDDAIERVFSFRVSRNDVRPLQPPAAPAIPTTTVAARPAPPRTTTTRPAGPVSPKIRPSTPIQVATGRCTGRMSTARAHACWDALLAAYPWPTATAFRILYCESTGDPNAANGRYHGLMQVDGASFDPAANIAAAYSYWQRRGWQPWACA